MAAPLPEIARRAEAEADAAFRYMLFCDARPPTERFTGLDPALAEQLLRHQFAGQEASHRAAYPRARRDIVEAGGTPVGRIVVDEGADVWTIVDVAIHTVWRGRGLGTRLLTQVMAEARAAGAVVRLNVMVGNPGAARLYQRLGFIPIAASEVDVEMAWRPTQIGNEGYSVMPRRQKTCKTSQTTGETL